MTPTWCLSTLYASFSAVGYCTFAASIKGAWCYLVKLYSVGMDEDIKDAAALTIITIL